MAADQEVIKQFLVSIGFKIDQAGAKKFGNQLSGTTNLAKTAGKAVLSVAVAAEAMVSAVALSMEKLYYASRRTGASVDNMKGMEAGFSRIGLKADGAREALEGMAAAVRTNPGMRGLMNMLTGKDTGKMDQAEAMILLVQKLSDMPHYQGMQYAQMFGIDEKTFLMLKDGMPELIKYQREYKELAAKSGVDLKAAAESSKDYANGLRDIKDRASLLSTKIATELMPVIKLFNSWIVKALDGLLNLTYAESHRSHRGGGTEGFTIGQADADGDEADHKEEARLLGKNKGAPAATGSPAGTSAVAPIPAPTSGKQTRGLRNNNPGNLNYAGQKGAELENPGGRFARFRTRQEGLQAMAGQLLKYRDRGIDSVRKIISKWAPSSENNTEAYVGTVAKQMGVNENARLNLKDPQVLASLMAAITKHENGYNPIGSSEMLAAAQSKLGKSGTTINQQTTINVAGGNAKETAGEVFNGQERVNSNLARNARGAVS